MKNPVLMLALCQLGCFAAMAQTELRHLPKKDTVRDIKNQPHRPIVQNRAARMRMQLKQIKYHDAQLKKVRDAQKKEHQQQD